MRKFLPLGLALVLAGALGGCAATPTSAQPTVEPTTATPCVDDPELIAAVDSFLAATSGDASVPVHGEPGGRKNNLIELLERSDLAAMHNPLGSGTLVSVVIHGGKALARDTASRTAWLVLDGVVYPVDVSGAQAFGFLQDGYPDEVKRAAGLGVKYSGLGVYGVADFVAYNADTTGKLTDFVAAANELCTTPTIWG